MKTFMNLPELFVGNVSVNLGRSNRGMAEHDLDRTDVGPVSQKIGGERVMRNKTVSDKIVGCVYTKIENLLLISFYIVNLFNLKPYKVWIINQAL